MKESRALKVFVVVLQCAAGLLLLWWATSRSQVDGKQVLNYLRGASLLSLGFGIVCFALVMYLGALRYSILLPSSVSTRYLISTSLIQNAFLNFLPWRVGEISYPILLHRDYKIPYATTSVTIVLIRLADMLIVLTVALIGAGSLELNLHLSYNVLVVTGVLVVVLGLFVGINRHLARTLILQVFLTSGLVYKPRRLLWFVFLSAAIFILSTIQSTFILRSVALAVSLPDVALLNALTLLAALVPVHPPGGWGTIDAIQTFILERLGYPAAVSLPSLLAAHSIYSVLITVGGIVGWLLRRIRRRLPATNYSHFRS